MWIGFCSQRYELLLKISNCRAICTCWVLSFGLLFSIGVEVKRNLFNL